MVVGLGVGETEQGKTLVLGGKGGKHVISFKNFGRSNQMQTIKTTKDNC